MKLIFLKKNLKEEEEEEEGWLGRFRMAEPPHGKKQIDGFWPLGLVPLRAKIHQSFFLPKPPHGRWFGHLRPEPPLFFFLFFCLFFFNFF
jgi:hypothetical protein